ncbi:MAG: hypothetical protein EOP09_03495, partial [Proteobacteria bacterium]
MGLLILLSLLLSPVQAGDARPKWEQTDFEFESPHPYPDSYQEEWEAGFPGASAIKLHFEKMDTEKTYDQVCIYTKTSSTPLKCYDGRRDNFWSEEFKVSFVRVEFTSDST